MDWLSSPLGIGAIVVLVIAAILLIVWKRKPIKEQLANWKFSITLKLGLVEFSAEEREKPKKSPSERGPAPHRRGPSVPADVLSRFVDRKTGLARFKDMLVGKTDRRILLVLVGPELGKTWFLLRLLHECARQRPSVPVVYLDFDQRRRGLTDFLSVARAIRRQLGDDCTPAICACDDENAGRASATPPTADRLARQREEIGRALGDDLARLGVTHRRVALLVDTFEYAAEDTCSWLEDWLFRPLRRWPHVLLVVAGRPVCQPFFESRPWGDLIAPHPPFDPFSEDEVLDYYRKCGLAVPKTEKLLLSAARTNPARMAQVGDWLVEQARGGAR